MTESASDHELLRRYVDEESQLAFTALVNRHVDLVYSAALRQVGVPAAAEEVTQSVFIDLARNAARFATGQQPLAPWLYVVTRRTAIDHVRGEARRRVREQMAVEIATMKNPSASWPQIAALLDEAMETLSAADRMAVVLRFFQHLSLREIGAALGVSEDTAQKRVSRAVERLRVAFVRRGVTATAVGLAADLSAHAVQTAPAGLGATISSVATKASTTLALSSATHALAMTAAQKILITSILIAALGTGLYQARVIARQNADQRLLRERAETLQGELAVLRTDRDKVAGELELARAQLEKLRANAKVVDPSLESALDGWLANVAKLKQRLEQTPEEKIPELQFATAKDWLDATKDPKLDTDLDMRRALSDLRRSAKQHFATQISTALERYLNANNHQPPTDASQLAPYFDGSVDPALLSRYAVGSMKDFPKLRLDDGNQDAWVLREKEPVDPYYDTAFFLRQESMGIQLVSTFGDEVDAAIKSFKAANNGQKPTVPAQLTLYLHSAIDPAFVQRRLDGKY